MNRYRIHATVRKTYVAEEDVTFEVEAEDEDSARKQARSEADDHADIYSSDADHEDTDIYVSQIDFIEGDLPEGEPVTPRCDKTPDMFT